MCTVILSILPLSGSLSKIQFCIFNDLVMVVALCGRNSIMANFTIPYYLIATRMLLFLTFLANFAVFLELWSDISIA